MALDAIKFGTVGSDIIVGSAYNQAIFGLQGDDTLEAGNYYDTLLVGGSGNDRYVMSRNPRVIIIDAGNSTADRFIDNPAAASADVMLTLDNSHLALYSSSSGNYAIIWDWEAPQSRIEYYQVQGKEYNFDQFRSLILNSSYYYGNFSLEALMGSTTASNVRSNVAQVKQINALYEQAAATQIPGFSWTQYLASNPGLMSAGIKTELDAKLHYMRYGQAEGRQIAFDPLQYLAANPDVVRAGLTSAESAATHYVQYGWQAGRKTSGFDAVSYLASNPDVAVVTGGNTTAAAQHYVNYGIREGRSTNSFDPLRYVASNPDLIRVFGLDTTGATLHYINYGIAEKRPTTSFNATRYLSANQDVARSLGYNNTVAYKHYIQYGYNQNRNTGGVGGGSPLPAVAEADAPAPLLLSELQGDAVPQSAAPEPGLAFVWQSGLDGAEPSTADSGSVTALPMRAPGDAIIALLSDPPPFQDYYAAQT